MTLPESPPPTRFPWLAFLLLAVSFVMAGCTGIGLALDGSYLWFMAVETGSPYIVHNRTVNVLLQAGPLLASRYLHSNLVVSALFTLAYLTPPLIGLLLSWLVIRKRAPGLLPWSIGWVLLAILPGQIDVVAEANIALQLFWPVFLMVLLGVRPRDVPLVVALAVLVIFTHPTSVALLALAALLSVRTGLACRDTLLMNGITSIILAVIAVFNLLRLANGLSGYETSMLSIGTLATHLWVGVAGEPALFLLMAWLAMGIVLRRSISRAPIDKCLGPQTPVMLLGLGGLFLGLRAMLPFRWAGAVSYHFYSLLAALPFLGMAVIDVYSWQQHSGPYLSLTPERRRVTQAALLIAAGVVTIQAASWYGFVSQLRSSMAASPDSCLSLDETPGLAWGQGTILEHWSTTALSVWAQPNAPTRLIVFEGRCAGQSFADGFQLAPWLRYGWGYNWFDLRQLGASLQPDG